MLRCSSTNKIIFIDAQKTRDNFVLIGNKASNHFHQVSKRFQLSVS